MTQRLGRVEDFERVMNALQDPKSEPWQYKVRSFGYCTECDEVVEYKSDAGPEGFYERCLKCGRESSGPLGSRQRRLILGRDMVPMAVKSEVDRWHSREVQREFLCELLGEYIANRNKERKRLRKQLRELDQQIKMLVSLQEKLDSSQS